MSGGMKSVARAMAAALTKSSCLAPSLSSTKLCAIAIFGRVPFDTSLILIVSPGLAGMDVKLYFMSSPPVISTVRTAEPAAGLVCGAPGDPGIAIIARVRRPDARDDTNMLIAPRRSLRSSLLILARPVECFGDRVGRRRDDGVFCRDRARRGNPPERGHVEQPASFYHLTSGLGEG